MAKKYKVNIERKIVVWESATTTIEADSPEAAVLEVFRQLNSGESSCLDNIEYGGLGDTDSTEQWQVPTFELIEEVCFDDDDED